MRRASAGPRDWEIGNSSRLLQLKEAELAQIPLFPLPGAVLFPRTFMPLHIFEPRYRALVSTALRDGGAMGVVLIDGKPPSEGPVRVHRVTGVGRIAQCEELPDGRFLILLAGLIRGRVVAELDTEEPFRRFAVEELPELPIAPAAAASALNTLRSCLRPVALTLKEGGAPLLEAAEHAESPGELADLLASVLIDSPLRRQALLEVSSAQERVETMVAFLAELLLSQRASKPFSELN